MYFYLAAPIAIGKEKFTTKTIINTPYIYYEIGDI